MKTIPTSVTFHGLAHDDAVDALARERAVRLTRFHARLMACKVTVEVPHRHHHAGRQIHVVIALSVSGAAPVVVRHEGAHRHATVPVRKAFDLAQRRLQHVAEEQRHEVKTHQALG